MSDCACGTCAACLMRALATRPDAIDLICAQPPERAKGAGFRRGLVERLRQDRALWRAKREEG